MGLPPGDKTFVHVLRLLGGPSLWGPPETRGGFLRDTQFFGAPLLRHPPLGCGFLYDDVLSNEYMSYQTQYKFTYSDTMLSKTLSWKTTCLIYICPAYRFLTYLLYPCVVLLLLAARAPTSQHVTFGEKHIFDHMFVFVVLKTRHEQTTDTKATDSKR